MCISFFDELLAVIVNILQKKTLYKPVTSQIMVVKIMVILWMSEECSPSMSKTPSNFYPQAFNMSIVGRTI
jgi:hypothetical protein